MPDVGQIRSRLRCSVRVEVDMVGVGMHFCIELPVRVHYLLNVSYANPPAWPRLSVGPLGSCQRARPDRREEHWHQIWRGSGRVRAVGYLFLGLVLFALAVIGLYCVKR